MKNKKSFKKNKKKSFKPKLKKKNLKKKSFKKKMNHHFGSSDNTVGVISDIEGKWKALETYAQRRNSVIDNNLLKKYSDEFDKIRNTQEFINKNEIKINLDEILKENCKLVFLGDLIDNGFDNIKLLTFFILLKDKYNDKVILIAGNRDINKLRLQFIENDENFKKDIERISIWHEKFSKLAKQDKTQKLKFIFDETMGAKGLFDRIKTELTFKDSSNKNQIPTEEKVSEYITKIYLDLIKSYLKKCQIIHVEKNINSIFIHGGIHNDNIGKFINKETEEEKNFDNWINNLNNEFQELIKKENFDDLVPLLEYQEPPIDKNKWVGESNDSSVLHSRPWNFETNNLRRIDIVKDNCYVTKLLENGINKEFVGHSPVGKLPIMIKKKIDKEFNKEFDYFYKVMCDTSSEVTAIDARYTPTISVTKNSIEIIDNFFCNKDECKELNYGTGTSRDELIGRRFEINGVDYWIVSRFLDIYVCATWRKEVYILPMYLLMFDGYLKNYLVDQFS